MMNLDEGCIVSEDHSYMTGDRDLEVSIKVEIDSTAELEPRIPIKRIQFVTVLPDVSSDDVIAFIQDDPPQPEEYVEYSVEDESPYAGGSEEPVNVVDCMAILPQGVSAKSLLPSKSEINVSCPLCPVTMVSSKKLSAIRKHMPFHDKHSFVCKDQKFLLCRLPCKLTKKSHYHCTCGKLVRIRSNAVAHVMHCLKDFNDDSEITTMTLENLLEAKIEEDLPYQDESLPHLDNCLPRQDETDPDRFVAVWKISPPKPKSDVASIQSEALSIQPDVSSIQPDVSSIQPDVSSIQPDVSSIQPDVSSIQPDVSLVDEEVDESLLQNVEFNTCSFPSIFRRGESAASLIPPLNGKNSKFACPLCSEDRIAPTRNYAMRLHMKKYHDHHSFAWKGYKFVICRLHCENSRRRSHYHCTCGRITRLRSVAMHHVKNCADLNKGMGIGLPQDLLDADRAVHKPVPESDPEPEGPIHHESSAAILLNGMTSAYLIPKAVTDITGCPLCPEKKIRPKRPYYIRIHLLRFHDKHSFVENEKRYVLCRLPCKKSGSSHYHCECGQAIRIQSIAKVHIKHCNGGIKEPKVKQLRTTKVQCPVCQEMISRMNIRRHLGTHMPEEQAANVIVEGVATAHLMTKMTKVQCPVCQQLKSERNLPRHLMMHRNPKRPPKRKKSVFKKMAFHKHHKLQCPICQQSCSKKNFAAHLISHPQEEMDAESILRNYGINIVADKGLLEFDEANEAVQSLRELWQPKNAHKVQCPICPKQLLKTSFKAHIRRHRRKGEQGEVGDYSVDWLMQNAQDAVTVETLGQEAIVSDMNLVQDFDVPEMNFVEDVDEPDMNLLQDSETTEMIVMENANDAVSVIVNILGGELKIQCSSPVCRNTKSQSFVCQHILAALNTINTVPVSDNLEINNEMMLQ